MADLFHDDFVAANGTTLASRGFTVAVDGGSTATIQGNQAEFLSVASGDWLNVSRALTLTDGGLAMPVRVGAGSGNKFFATVIRASVDVDGFYTAGYALGFDIGSRTATLYRMDTWATITTQANFTPVDQAALWWVKFEAEGTTIRAKAWAVGDTEPGAWGLSTTNAVFGSGRTGIALEGFAAGSRAWFADVWRTYDFTAPLEAGGVTLTIDGSGTDDLHTGGGTHYNEPGGTELAILASGIDARGASEPGGVEFEVVASGSDALTHAPETGSASFEVTADGVDSLHVSDAGMVTFEILASGVDEFGWVEAGGVELTLLADGDDIHTQREFGGVGFAVEASGTDAMSTSEVGGATFEVATSGIDTHTPASTAVLPGMMRMRAVVPTLFIGTRHEELGATEFSVTASGTDEAGADEAGGVTFEILTGGSESQHAQDLGGETFAVITSGTDLLRWTERGSTTILVDADGADSFTGVDVGRVVAVFSMSGIDHASTDTDPLPRLSLVIPRVNELQWRALVDWANDLVAELESRFADD